MISIENVNYHIGNTNILKNINLTLKNNQITALIGPNGAGKSSLFSLIARLQPLQQGKIKLDNLDISHTKSNSIAKQLALLTQENQVQSRLTVYDLLMFARYPHNLGKATPQDQLIVTEILNQFGLTPLINRYIGELSGGQRQRVFIAMAVCQQTPHLLLDEPLNNLDMFHAKELMKLLKKITQKHKLCTVIVVHDINIAAAYADTIIALKNGEVVLQGTPAEVITKSHIQHIFNVEADVVSYQETPLVIHHM